MDFKLEKLVAELTALAGPATASSSSSSLSTFAGKYADHLKASIKTESKVSSSHTLMEQISDKMTTATNSNPTTSSSSDAAVKHFKDAYLELRRQQNPDLDEFMLLLHKVHTEPLIASAVGVERVPLLVNNEQQTSSSSSESSLVKPPTSKPMVAVPPTSRHSVSTAPPITSTTSNNNNSLAGSLRDPNADPIQLSQALIERLRAVNSSTSVSSTLAAAAAAAASASSNNTASISSPSRTIRSAVGSGSVGVGLTGSGVAGGAPGGLLRSSRSSINLSSSARGSRSDLTSAAGGGSGATTGMVDAEVSRAIKDVVVDGGGDSVGGGGGLFRARSFSANNISEVAASGDQSLSASNFSSSMLLDGSTLLGSLTPNADKSRQHPTLRFSSPSKTTKISTPKKQAMTMKSSLHKGVLFQSTSGAAGASSRTGTKGGSSTSSSNATAVTPILTDIGTLSLEQQEAFISDDVLYALLGIDGNYISKSLNGKPVNMNDFCANDVDRFKMIHGLVFEIDATLDASLTELVRKMLPLASDYMLVEAFVETYSAYEYGRVNNALAAAIRELLKEYLILIAQLEHQVRTRSTEFGLSKLWFYLQSTMNTMSSLAGLVRVVMRQTSTSAASGASHHYNQHYRICKGGNLLNILAERMVSLSGDPAIKKMYMHLLSVASKPYLVMLRNWIKHGQIVDAGNEFLIEEIKRPQLSSFNPNHVSSLDDVDSTSSTNTTSASTALTDTADLHFWESKYRLIHSSVPKFLENVKEKVLLAGKYLNVVRACGQDLMLDGNSGDGNQVVMEEINTVNVEAIVGGLWDVVRCIDGGRFIKEIEVSYNLANCRLLKLLLNEHHLLKRLRSIKRYFLLDQSDFLTSFMDLSLPTLLLPSSQIKVEKLKSLLELVLRNPSSVSYSDPYKDDLYIEMGRRSFFDQLDRITSVVALERNSVDGLDAGLGGGDAAAAAANKPRGVDAIMLGYTVKFPLSLVLDENAIEEYQLLFRYLFQCKYVEYILCKNWIDQGWSRMRGRGGMAASASTPTTPNKGSVRKVVSMSAMMSSSSSSSPTAKTLSLSSSSNKDPQHILMELLEPRMCILRAKMLTFIQQFMYYGCYEVIEPNWRKLEEQLGGGGGESHENMVQSVEQVLSLHRDFLSTCMKECMLSNPKLVKSFKRLVQVCIQFSSYAAWFHARLGYLRTGSVVSSTKGDHMMDDDEGLSIPPPSLYPGSSGDEAGRGGGEVICQQVVNFDKMFSTRSANLLNELRYYGATETQALANLAARLDFNGFYSGGV